MMNKNKIVKFYVVLAFVGGVLLTGCRECRLRTTDGSVRKISWDSETNIFRNEYFWWTHLFLKDYIYHMSFVVVFQMLPFTVLPILELELDFCMMVQVLSLPSKTATWLQCCIEIFLSCVEFNQGNSFWNLNANTLSFNKITQRNFATSI